MVILHLTAANLRRGKGSALSLAVLILLAAMLLNVGLGVLVNNKPFFLNKIEETHGPHNLISMHHDLYKPEYLEFFEQDDRVTEAEAEGIIYMGQAAIRLGGEIPMGMAFLNAAADRTIAPLNPLETAPVPSEQAVYVPLSLKNGGYKLGDSLAVTYLENEYRFTIAGYYESTSLGLVNAGALKFFLSGEAFERLESKAGKDAASTLLSVRMKDPEQSAQLLRDFKAHTDAQLSGAVSLLKTNVTDYAGMSMTSTMMISIFAVLLAAFALIIVLVVLIVIRFRVVNSVEDQITNLGALGAIGYTSRQMSASLVLQFMIIAAVGAMAGIGLSYAVAPFVGEVMTGLAGLHWKGEFQPWIDAVSMLVVVLLVGAVAFLASRRVKKLPPVVALRGGVHTHSFRKNHFPLDQSRGGLQLVLALKSLASQMKQNAIVAIIVAGVTFASVFSVITYYNVSVDKTAIFKMAGAEISDIVVTAHPNADADKLFEELQAEPGVVRTSKLDMTILSVGEEDTVVQVSDDYSRMGNLSAYEGRMPKYDNEVVITGVLADLLDKKIGDTLEIVHERKNSNFLVTGLTQTMNNSGRVAFIMESGIQQLIPDFNIQSVYMYLDEGPVSVEEYITRLKKDYAGRIAQVQNYRELGETQLSTYTGAITLLMTVVLAATAIVVSLILYLVIHAMILRKKRDLGIYKALGYTAFQLKTQMALSFVPVVAAGAAAGGILGALGINPMLSMLLYSVGISNARFDIHVPMIALLCGAVTLFAYIVSMWASRRINRISAYGLIVE